MKSCSIRLKEFSPNSKTNPPYSSKKGPLPTPSVSTSISPVWVLVTKRIHGVSSVTWYVVDDPRVVAMSVAVTLFASLIDSFVVVMEIFDFFLWLPVGVLLACHVVSCHRRVLRLRSVVGRPTLVAGCISWSMYPCGSFLILHSRCWFHSMSWHPITFSTYTRPPLDRVSRLSRNLHFVRRVVAESADFVHPTIHRVGSWLEIVIYPRHVILLGELNGHGAL